MYVVYLDAYVKEKQSQTLVIGSSPILGSNRYRREESGEWKFSLISICEEVTGHVSERMREEEWSGVPAKSGK